MNRTFKCIALSGALLISPVYVLLSAPRAAATATAAQVKKVAGKGAAKIEGVYLQNCARCHGADGRGETPLGKLYSTPNLTDPTLHARFSNKELSAIVANGRAAMPAFKKTLAGKEIAALVAYVRRFKK